MSEERRPTPPPQPRPTPPPRPTTPPQPRHSPPGEGLERKGSPRPPKR